MRGQYWSFVRIQFIIKNHYSTNYQLVTTTVSFTLIRHFIDKEVPAADFFW